MAGLSILEGSQPRALKRRGSSANASQLHMSLLANLCNRESAQIVFTLLPRWASEKGSRTNGRVLAGRSSGP